MVRHESIVTLVILTWSESENTNAYIAVEIRIDPECTPTVTPKLYETTSELLIALPPVPN